MKVLFPVKNIFKIVMQKGTIITHICFDEIGSMGDKVLCRRHFSTFLYPDEVLDRVQPLLLAGGRQELLDRHRVAQKQGSHLPRKQQGRD